MKKWATRLCRLQSTVDPLALVAAVADRVAEALDVDPVSGSVGDDLDLNVASGVAAALDLGPPPPGGWGDPWLVGAVHERAVPADDRRARGAWYTPRPVVEGLVRLAFPDAGAPERVIDPTCGGGGFLLAALDCLVARGVAPSAAVERVAGIDIEPGAVLVTRWSLMLWLGASGEDLGPKRRSLIEQAVVRGDALVEPPVAVDDLPVVIVGNPPFASPLKRGAVPSSAADYRRANCELLGPYADIAAAHLLRAVESAPEGSTVALVQPQSILASRDTEALRDHLDVVAPVRALWAAREAVFDAGIRACAPILTVGASPGAVKLAFGPEVSPRRTQPSDQWGHLAADALGAPVLPAMTGRLGELVSATAGFRDEHYGLVAACREEATEDDGLPRLVTVGSIDPLSVAWGVDPFRFGRADRRRPVIDRAVLPDGVKNWFDRQLRPKVLLATQTKLLEPVVDRAGDLVPATPLIAVHGRPEDLDRVAAVLLAPPVVLWAWRRWFGTALTVDAVKLAARQVVELPLPIDDDAWTEAAGLVATADRLDRVAARAVAADVARIMTEAYGAADDVLAWWQARLGE